MKYPLQYHYRAGDKVTFHVNIEGEHHIAFAVAVTRFLIQEFEEMGMDATPLHDLLSLLAQSHPVSYQ